MANRMSKVYSNVIDERFDWVLIVRWQTLEMTDFIGHFFVGVLRPISQQDPLTDHSSKTFQPKKIKSDRASRLAQFLATARSSIPHFCPCVPLSVPEIFYNFSDSKYLSHSLTD